MRGNVYGRLERLEGRVKPEPMDTTRSPRPDITAVLGAYGNLKGAMSDKHSRGGVPIPPVNRAEEVYGPRYTQEQFRELAIRTGLEGRGYAPDEIDERVPSFLELFDLMGGEDPHIGAVHSEADEGGGVSYEPL